MARPPTSVDIKRFNYLFQYYDNYYDIPSWLDDCIQGGCRVGHSNPASPFAIFNYLRFFTTIDLPTVTSFVSNKYRELFGREPSQRLCYSFMNRLVATVSILDYQVYKRDLETAPKASYVELEVSSQFIFADGIRINLETGEYFS